MAEARSANAGGDHPEAQAGSSASIVTAAPSVSAAMTDKATRFHLLNFSARRL